MVSSLTAVMLRPRAQQRDRLRGASGEIEQPFRDVPSADGVVLPVRFRVRLLHDGDPQSVPARATERGREVVQGSALVDLGPRPVGASRDLDGSPRDREARVHDDAAPPPAEKKSDEVRAAGGGGGGGGGRRRRRPDDPPRQVLPFRDHRERGEEPAVPDRALPDVRGVEHAVGAGQSEG